MKVLVHKILRRMASMRSHFGSRCVQSPYAWQFINDVLSNTTPYQAYSDLATHLRALSRRERKIARMMLRLANYLQPTVTWLPVERMSFAPFVERGCRGTEVKPCETIVPMQACDAPVLLGVEAMGSVSALPEKGWGGAVVVFGISRTAATLANWRKLQDSPWATLTFDLGHTGLILVNSAYSKQHYVRRLKG